MYRDDEVGFVAHPPERRRRSTTLLSAGCCCCCCCCVHTLGGIVGAVVGARRKDIPAPETLTTPEAVRIEAEKKAANRLVIRVYWLCVTIVAVITCVVCVAVNPNEPIVGPAMVLGFLPIGQLVASIMALMYLNVAKPPRERECASRLGRITLMAFFGTILGCLGTALSFFAIIH